MNKIKITSKGQITIPMALREELEIKEGMYLSGYIKDGRKKVEALIDDYENAYLHDSKREGSGINIQKYFNPDELRKRLITC